MLNKKILFLDVDGVLNIMGTSYRSFSKEESNPLEEIHVARLNFIMSRVTNLKIVISSSWGYEDIVNKLSEYGFNYIDSVIDRTRRHEQYRGEQILDWVNTHDVSRYIVLEDEISDVCGEKCNVIPSYNVIEVNMFDGLSDINAVETILRLNKDKCSFEDGVEYTINDEVYDKAYAGGYRLNVTLSKDEFRKKYLTFSISKRHLSINGCILR